MTALSVLLFLAGCGREEQQPESTSASTLTTASSSSALQGCYAGPNGDDNANLYRFEANGVVTHLDTWNRGMGLPNTQLGYTYADGVLTMEGSEPAPVSVEADALLFTASSKRWPAVSCNDYSW